jgi:hypothetical protein
MTTLLDKQRSTTRKVPSPEEATLDQVLSRIAALAPMVARLAPDIEQGRDCQRSSCPLSNQHGSTGCSYPRVMAVLNLTRRAPFGGRGPGQARWVGGLERHDWPNRRIDAVPDEPDFV